MKTVEQIQNEINKSKHAYSEHLKNKIEEEIERLIRYMLENHLTEVRNTRLTLDKLCTDILKESPLEVYLHKTSHPRWFGKDFIEEEIYLRFRDKSLRDSIANRANLKS